MAWDLDSVGGRRLQTGNLRTEVVSEWYAIHWKEAEPDWEDCSHSCISYLRSCVHTWGGQRAVPRKLTKQHSILEAGFLYYLGIVGEISQNKIYLQKGFIEGKHNMERKNLKTLVKKILQMVFFTTKD